MASTPPSQYVSGSIKNITYHNPDNGYFVVKILDSKNKEIAVVGKAPAISPGEIISAKGVWKSGSYGPQFEASSVELTAPKESAGIEKYLVHSVGGIGPSFAKKLVAALGSDLFRVVREEPEKLSSIQGIGPKRAASVVQSILEGEDLRAIMVFLYQNGLSASRAKRVYQTLGPRAVQKLKENPYLMVSVWGVGFSSADSFAKSLGIGHESDYRVRAGVLHCLNMAKSEGCCGLPESILVEKTKTLLEVSENKVLDAIAFEVLSGSIVPHDYKGSLCYYPKSIFELEQRLAKEIVRLHTATPRLIVPNIDWYISDNEKKSGIVLEASQREAVKMALSHNVCIITGGPGCGKTTITRVVLEVFKAMRINIVLAAPTGKAARRASDATGFEASTVHRVLEIAKDGKFKYNSNNKLTADVVGLDESSMLDLSLTESALQAISAGSRVVFIGDCDQLDSVGAGRVLYDLIVSGVVPVVRLTQVFRQAATSKIIVNAHKVNNGECPDPGYKEGDDFGFITPDFKYPDRDDERRALQKKVIQLVVDSWKKGFDPIKDVQVLVPMKAGDLGTKALNQKLQAALNPFPSDTLERFGLKWCTGDKVIHMRNNYTKMVFNGEVGFIKEISHDDKKLYVEYDSKLIEYEFNDLDEIQHAYAMTVHKSQGSEFPVVVMAMDNSHFMMLKRKILFTGITRAKKLMLLVGTKWAVKEAVANNKTDERYTLLSHWLRESYLEYEKTKNN